MVSVHTREGGHCLWKVGSRMGTIQLKTLKCSKFIYPHSGVESAEYYRFVLKLSHYVALTGLEL